MSIAIFIAGAALIIAAMLIIAARFYKTEKQNYDDLVEEFKKTLDNDND